MEAISLYFDCQMFQKFYLTCFRSDFDQLNHFQPNNELAIKRTPKYSQRIKILWDLSSFTKVDHGFFHPR